MATYRWPRTVVDNDAVALMPAPANMAEKKAGSGAGSAPFPLQYQNCKMRMALPP